MCLKNSFVMISVLSVVLVFFGVNTVAVANYVLLDDGATHTIDDDTYVSTIVMLDRDTAIPNFPGTHVTLTEGGVVENIWAYDNATVEVTGGFVAFFILASGNCRVSMTGGGVGMSVEVYDNASAIIAGGDVGAELRAYENGTIYLEGGVFEVTDSVGYSTSLSYGDRLSDFGSLVEWRPEGDIRDYYTGTIAGTLADGSVLNTEFRIFNSGTHSGVADVTVSGVTLTVAAGTVIGQKIDDATGGGKVVIEDDAELVCAGDPFGEGYVTWAELGLVKYYWRTYWHGASSDTDRYIDIDGDYDLRFTRFQGMGKAVITGAAGGTIYVSPVYDSNLYAVDPNDGGVKWSVDLVVSDGEAPAPPDALAEWSMSESTGMVVVDSSGNGYDGRMVNMSDLNRVSGRLVLNGVDEYVLVEGFKGITSSSPRTCMASFATTQGNGEIIGWGQTGPGGGRWTLRLDEAGRLRVEVGGGAVVGTTVLTDGELNWVVVVSDGKDVANTNLYVGGEVDPVSSCSPQAIDTVADADVRIGEGLKGRYFAGEISNIQLYDRAFSKKELHEWFFPSYVWQRRRLTNEGSYCWSEPVVGPDGTIYVSFDDACVRAVNPDGSIKWVTRVGMAGALRCRWTGRG